MYQPFDWFCFIAHVIQHSCCQSLNRFNFFPIYNIIFAPISYNNIIRKPYMSTLDQLVSQYLPQLNLNFNSSINPMVISFLKHDVGVINDIQPQYQIYGAAAIISETQQLKTLEQNCTSHNGITIQSVMSHLGSLSKESFLNTLNTQIQRLKNLPQNVKTLKKRVQDIRYSYRFFKKYQQSFEALYSKFLPRKLSTKDDFCALFWVVFLYIKNQHIQTQSITQSKHLLIILLGLVFSQYICKADKTSISPFLSKHIGNLPQPNDEKQLQEQQKKLSYYKKLIEEKLDSFYSQRFSSQKTDFAKLMENFTYVERLVDDMSNAYKKDEEKLKYYNEVDELSYLELKKNLTPQVFRKVQLELSIEPIKTALLFDDQDQPEEQSDNGSGIVEESQNDDQITVGYTVRKEPHLEEPVTPPSTLQQYTSLNSNTTSPITTPKWFPLSSIEPICPITLFDSSFNATPISKKCQNQQYLRQKILKCGKQHIISFDKLISAIQANKMQQQKHTKEHPHQDISPLTQKITQLIKDFTPKCQHPTQRTHEILSFIISNLNELIPLSLQTSSSGDLVYGIICLSCELFNYVNNSISCQYKHHCQVFGVGCSVAYQALEMFSSKLSGAMPLDLQEYLKKLKKRFFVCDVWEGENGYDIIRNHGTNPQLKSIYEAIVSFSTARIKQICQPCSIQPKIVAKTTNMIHYLFDHNPNLFQYNNIDQLILCCLMSCLSINEKHQHKTLELLFYEYSANIQFAFNSNQQGLKDSQGKEMKIVEYYNEVFLEEIKDMLTVKFQQIDDFLLTPVRINKSLTLTNMGKRFSSLKQDPMKKEHKEGLFKFNPEKMKDKKTTYIQNLVKQNQAIINQEMKEQKEEEDNDDIHSSKEDLPSPSFGMSRLYSFRKPSQQK